jgi:hypothetical protein
MGYPDAPRIYGVFGTKLIINTPTKYPSDDEKYSTNNADPINYRDVGRMATASTQANDDCIHAGNTEDDYTEEKHLDKGSIPS